MCCFLLYGKVNQLYIYIDLFFGFPSHLDHQVIYFRRVCIELLSCVLLFGTPWTVACQAPLPMEFPGKNTGVGCHFLLQGIFLNHRSNLGLLCLLHWLANSLPLALLHILYIAVYICQSQSPNSSHPPPPSWCPYLCSLCLCLSALQTGSSVPFFLDSTSKWLSYVSFSVWLSLLCMTVSRSFTSLQMAQFLSFLWLSNFEKCFKVFIESMIF